MLGLFPRADWVTQFMLQSSLSTDLGMLTSPLGMQAAVVAESVDHQQSSGSFSQRFLIVPAFGANGLSGGACVTQYSDRRHPLHEKALLKADVRIGRWIRDDASRYLYIVSAYLLAMQASVVKASDFVTVSMFTNILFSIRLNLVYPGGFLWYFKTPCYVLIPFATFSE